MEYTISSFADRLVELFTNSKKMPKMADPYVDKYGREQSDDKKHKNRPQPRNLKFQIWSSLVYSKVQTDNIITMDIGNEHMEEYFPYYHILQQAPVIRKRGRATKKSAGSQMYEKNIKKRDYEKVHWNGKTFTKEYSRNVRGSRVNLNKTQMHLDNEWLNTGSNQYLNMHYGYIDTIAEEVAHELAKEFEMRLGRTQDSGLIDEFAIQEGTDIDTVLEAFGSFM